MKVRVKSLEECLEIDSNLFWINHSFFRKELSNQIKTIDCNTYLSGHTPSVSVGVWRVPLTFLHMPFLFRINNKGKLREEFKTDSNS